jgi:hypothetical protein
VLLFPSTSNPNVMPPPKKPRPQGNSKDGGPQVLAAEATHRAGDPVLKTIPAPNRAVTNGATATAGAAVEASSSQP